MRTNAPAGVLLALALVGALVVLGAVTSPAVAQTDEGNITVERTDNSLELTVDANQTGNFDTIRLVVDESGEVVNETLSTGDDVVTETDNNQTQVELDLFDFPGGLPADQNLSTATVEVVLERNGTVVETTQSEQDLAAVRFDEESVAFENGSLHVTATELVGAGESVRVSLAGETTVDATVEQEVGSWSLNVPLAESNTAFNVFEPFDVVAFPGSEGEETVASGLNLPTRVDPPTITAGDETLTLEYGLIFAGGSYNVTVADAGETKTVQANSYGTLGLSEIADTVLLSGNTTLSVQRGGASVVDGLQVPFDNSEVFGLASERAGSPSFSLDGRTVSHPLLFSGESYGVTIETTGPDGRLTFEQQAGDSGLSLPKSANSTLVAEEVRITVTSPDSHTLFEDEPLFGDESQRESLTPVSEITASMDGQQLNLSTADIGLGDATTLWFHSDDTLTQLNATHINESAGLVDLSSVDQLPGENETVSMVLFRSDSTVLDRLDVTLTERDVEAGDSAALIVVPDGWTMPFGVGWFASATVVVLLLGVFKIIRVPHVGEPGGYGLFAWAAGNALGISFLVYFLVPRMEFGIGVVGGTCLVMGAFLILQTKPQDPQALALALAAGIGVTGILVMAGQVVDQSVLGIGVGTGYGTLAGTGLALWSGKHRSSSQEQAAGGSKSGPVDVQIVLVDALTGERVDTRANVQAQQQSRRNTGMRPARNSPSTNEQPLSVRGGTASDSFEPGKWTFKIETHGQTTEQTESIRNRTDRLQLEIPGRQLSVQVQSSDGSAIGNADVVVESSSYTDRGATNRDGRFQATLPADTASVEITAEHELYKANTVSVDASRNSEASVVLEPRVGQLHVSATLGRDSVAGVSVTAQRQSTPRREVSGTTDERGAVEFRDLLIGRYDLTVDLPTTSGAFSVTEQSARIEEGSRDRRDVTVRFEYSLSRDHKRRIRELRNELDEIAQSSRRDDAIQGYYASVLHAVLDAVERVPRSGHPFLKYNTEPDAAVEALLTAAEETTATMDTVLTSQRNVNLFSACSELPEAAVEWRGNVDIADMLREASRDVGQQRAEVNEQLEAVDETISAELRDLAEVSPAREMWEGLRDMLRDQGGLDELEVAASIFVALLLLDAVESVFEHRELRKRLEQTVY